MWGQPAWDPSSRRHHLQTFAHLCCHSIQGQIPRGEALVGKVEVCALGGEAESRAA